MLVVSIIRQIWIFMIFSFPIFLIFQVRQHEFREDFRKTAPFAFDSVDFYDNIDQVLD